MTSKTVHATAVVAGTSGLLIRGPSASGKSLLARDIIADADRRGRFAALVSDDRVVLEVCGGRLTAHQLPQIRDRIEFRGFGIVSVKSEASAVIRAVVDFVPHKAIERLPEEDQTSIEIMSLHLPLLQLPANRRVPLDMIEQLITRRIDAPPR